ncbi:antitoxin [Arsenicicoccus sp. oral taxon 190]|uniref:antitoxin n=1 Tax=Arsenicicoccus sp. oral taxon 190 TaxID=1658671 RepID=UPI00067D5181|nr:antitoxin [Arsenicicoccus sp. oral taxon 190]
MTTGPTGTPPQQPGPSGSPLETFLHGAEDAVVQARTQVARTTQANRGKISGALDKLVRTVDDKTGRRYHSQVQTAKGWVEKGVDVVAGAPAAPGAPAGSAAPSSPAPGAPAAPTTPTTAAPDKPKEGWHRGPDGQWTRSS